MINAKELIARKVDRLGRIVIPKELRDNMRITHDDPLEIYVKDDNIVITKYNPIDDADGVAFLRNVDKLGRIVIPKELRDSMNIKYNDRLKIFIDFQNIVIKQCNKMCIFCGSRENLKDTLGLSVCSGCLAKIKSEA